MSVHIYSHSRVSTFETCPRQYWYGYIEKPDIERVTTVEAFLGSQVHETLEDLYQRRPNGRLMSVEEMLACYEEVWECNWEDSIRIVRPKLTADDFREVGCGPMNPRGTGL